MMEKSTSPGYVLSAVSKQSLLMLPEWPGTVVRTTAQSSRQKSLSGPYSVARLGGRNARPVSFSPVVHTNLQNVQTIFKTLFQHVIPSVFGSLIKLPASFHFFRVLI